MIFNYPAIYGLYNYDFYYLNDLRMPESDLQHHQLTSTVLKGAIESTPDGIFIVDQSGIIIFCNTAMAGLFGYSLEDLHGKHLFNIIQFNTHYKIPATEHEGLKTISNYIGKGMEVYAIRFDGSTYSARLSLSHTTVESSVYFSGIIHDLTDVKTIENDLIRLNQELEQMIESRTTELQDAVNRLLDTNLLLNQSIEKHKAYEAALVTARDELKKSLDKEKELGSLKSRFISMASHEFKTPLSSILSSAALISRYNKSEHSPDRERHIERIKASVTHLNTILTDFLSITRLEEGRFELQITNFRLDYIISDLLSEMEVLLKPLQTLQFEYKTDKLDMVSDKNIVRNILYNLLSNAIKYSDEETSIACKVKRKGTNVILEIKDEGIGIPAKDRPHIGTRFFRSSNVTHLQGTGLGLNIVRSYLNFLQGSLSFKSHQDVGTTFIVSIPAKHEA